ncbi:DUF445 domain-containing protein [Evansella cellulosilytica]|uniref:DUF445 family protein n=1 Tax=Evansella cellulosilytica (strain ATCC 21833 / DSM 2522 / FERM P-1141 / JCM 9156 / N-4) TaxID=649639 RepID=E6TUF7_EVAC2|nr:DUF445 family protein [Evansella cellulosilytica]ADU29713.1 protein of unknown function DUF445 [Evansella cellulosilytica DSM 2522]
MIMEMTWLLSLVVVGAIIGGGTNVLAIRMLFRPYKPIQIASIRIPFTPGLIPKRREELADQLGRMVEEHLITPEGISRRIFHQSFLKLMEEKLKEAVLQFMRREESLAHWLNSHEDKIGSLSRIDVKVQEAMNGKIISLIDEYKGKKIKDILLEEWIIKLESQIPTFSSKLLNKAELYVQSPEGEEVVKQMLSRFFDSKGNVGSFFGKMLQRTSPTTLIIKELTKLLQDDKTKEVVSSWIRNEMKEQIDKTPEQLLGKMNVETNVLFFSERLMGEIPIIGEMHQPINQWSQRYENVILHTLLPKVVDITINVLQINLKSAVKRIGIRDIVTEQVNAFPLRRLETILLTIAKKELKMIAVLGAAIGAMIGLVQGVSLLFFL